MAFVPFVVTRSQVVNSSWLHICTLCSERYLKDCVLTLWLYSDLDIRLSRTHQHYSEDEIPGIRVNEPPIVSSNLFTRIKHYMRRGHDQVFIIFCQNITMCDQSPTSISEQRNENYEILLQNLKFVWKRTLGTFDSELFRLQSLLFFCSSLLWSILLM